jgi:hypothetical protein
MLSGFAKHVINTSWKRKPLLCKKNNGFTFPEIPQHIKTLHPTPTEERCCSLRIHVMQIKELGIGKQYGIFGNTVNVPMNPAEVVSFLSRRITDTATKKIQLDFMRRTCLHSFMKPFVQKLFTI